MSSAFGPLEFTKRLPRSGILLFGAFTLLALVSAAWTGSQVRTALDLLPFVASLVAALGLGTASGLLGSTSWRFYRDGVVQRRMWKTTALRYSDVIASAYQEVDGGVRGPDVWAMTLHGRRGERVAVRVQPDLKREVDLPALHARLLPSLVAQLRQQLATGVPWGPLKLLRDGLQLVDGQMLPYGPELDARGVLTPLGLTVLVDHRGQSVATLAPDTLNLHVGLELLRERRLGRTAADVTARAAAAGAAAGASKDVRDRRLGWALAVFFVVASAGEAALFVSTLRDHRALGTAPRVLAAAVAGEIGHGPAWVELSDRLSVACDAALVESSQGAVRHTAFLATDEAGGRWFYVKLRGRASCADASGPGLVGLLEPAGPGFPGWLAKQGLVVPAGARDLVKLTVGDGPRSLERDLWFFGGGAAFFALLLGVAIYVVVSRRPGRGRAAPA